MKFSQVVMEVMRQIEGAYALIFKSSHYPNELVACKCGSPLLLGVKVMHANKHMNNCFFFPSLQFPVTPPLFSQFFVNFFLSNIIEENWIDEQECGEENKRGAFVSSELTLAKDGKPKEFFLASDASAMVEHTKKVMVIEDNEVVHVRVRISCHSRILLKLMTSLLL